MARSPAIRRVSVAVDIVGYTKLTDSRQADAQGRLAWMMVNSLRAAGVDPGRCERQNQGDGQLILLPPTIDEAHVLPTVVRALHSALHQLNRVPGPAGPLRMRVALAQGPTQIAATGYVGPGVVSACRMLDSPPIRTALKRNQDVDLAIIVSDDLYHQVFAQEYGDLLASEFQPVRVDLPAKGFGANAWLHLPEVTPKPGLVPDFTGVSERRGFSAWRLAIPVAVVSAGSTMWGVSHNNDHGARHVGADHSRAHASPPGHGLGDLPVSHPEHGYGQEHHDPVLLSYDHYDHYDAVQHDAEDHETGYHDPYYEHDHDTGYLDPGHDDTGHL